MKHKTRFIQSKNYAAFQHPGQHVDLLTGTTHLHHSLAIPRGRGHAHSREGDTLNASSE